jgi:hypothetical protein
MSSIAALVKSDEWDTRYRKAVDELIKADGDRALDIASLVVGCVLVLTCIGIPIGLWIGWRLWKKKDRREFRARECHAFTAGGMGVAVYPLVVPGELRRPGVAVAPGLVLACFDADVTSAEITSLALAICSFDDAGWTDADRQLARRIMSDHAFVPHRRRLLPATMAGRHTMYVCDLVLLSGLFKGGCLTDEVPMVPCFAEPGERGRMVQMPYWVATGESPSAVEREALKASLMTLGLQPRSLLVKQG